MESIWSDGRRFSGESVVTGAGGTLGGAVAQLGGASRAACGDDLSCDHFGSRL